MNYAILVNTCDKFEDCWDPFFKLWSTYWPDCKGRLYLNTEYKDYSYPGLDITAVKGCEGRVPKGTRATWSQCLKWALEQMDEDIVLYMQEDYFLHSPVKNDLVEYYANLMRSNPEIRCIHLTDQSVESDGESWYMNLDVVQLDQRCRVSCQAALWYKEELLALLREQEDAWEFEEFGSMRSAVLAHLYLCVSPNYVKKDVFEIIPYIFTGIVQGRWYEPTVELFAKHGIEMDWNRRGFLADAPKKPFMDRVRYRLRKIPKIIACRIELARMMVQH